MTMEKNVKPSDTLRKERRPFFCACGAILFSAYPFSESKISAPAERKFGICAYGANRFFF